MDQTQPLALPPPPVFMRHELESCGLLGSHNRHFPASCPVPVPGSWPTTLALCSLSRPINGRSLTALSTKSKRTQGPLEASIHPMRLLWRQTFWVWQPLCRNFLILPKPIITPPTLLPAIPLTSSDSDSQKTNAGDPNPISFR